MREVQTYLNVSYIYKEGQVATGDEVGGYSRMGALNERNNGGQQDKSTNNEN